MAGRTDRRGFTLVEAVIVVVVIAVILAVTIPWLSECDRRDVDIINKAQIYCLR